MNLCLDEHGRSHYLLRNHRKRKYDGKLLEELLSERNDYLKKSVEQGKTTEKMYKDLEDYSELKIYYQQNETFNELFDKEIIDHNGKIVDKKLNIFFSQVSMFC